LKIALVLSEALKEGHQNLGPQFEEYQSKLDVHIPEEEQKY
jgi:hypothetical protein